MSNIELTAEIVAAFVANNPIAADELPGLIRDIHGAIVSAGAPVAAAEALKADAPSAAAIRKSITPHALISFEDGKPYKALKRHLTKHGMTPGGYRAKWSLPADYPMVSANYSATRSALAKSMGLGQPAAAPAQAVPEPGTRPRKKLGLFGS